jgi:mannose-6-phosphate isomerase class I
MECKASAAKDGASDKEVRSSSAEQRRPSHLPVFDPVTYEEIWRQDEEQHLFAYPVKQASGVIWLSGRAFLVGTPAGVDVSLARRFPNNVVLLSWAHSHIAGFGDYAAAWLQKAPPEASLAVWTSDWIWEHVLDMFPNSELPISRLRPVIFDVDHIEHFAPRTTLSMAYSVGRSSPELYAHFRLLDSHLVVGLDRALPGSAPPLGLPVVSAYQTLMSRIYDWYPQSHELMAPMLQRRIKQLSDASILAPLSCARGAWWYRFSLSAGTVERVLHPDCGKGNSSGGACRPGDACQYTSEFIAAGKEFAQEVCRRSIYGGFSPPDLPSSEEVDACDQWNRQNFLSFDSCPKIPAAAAPPDEPLQQGIGESIPVSLVIGCGAPPTRWHGKINPDRRIVLGGQDVSVLESKLRQYIAQKQDRSGVFSNLVYVLVSPATESLVREELARIWREFKSPLDGAEYRILRNRVVPRFEKPKTGGLRCFRQNDDGFQYNPAGHFDLLWCIKNDDRMKGLFYYTNLTNLGINVTPEVAVLRSHLAETKADAVFELVPHDDSKNGMGAGSYWVERSERQMALIKPVYCGEEQEGRGWQGDRNRVVSDIHASGLYMSTGSVLIDAESIRKHWDDLNKLPWYARRRRPLRTPSSNRDDELRWSVQLERDLDQITWAKNVKCSGVVISPPNQRRRFFAVKRESDLYQKSYTELRELYLGLPRFGAGSASPVFPPHAPLALVPNEQHDPWGNDLLRFLKKLPQSDIQVSETWESSAYPLGMSHVERNTLESVPLSDVVPELTEKMNVMSKLLDCHGNLSIQIHPCERVCRVLSDAGRALQDNAGKEENFYVIHASEPSVFYLGLNADRVFETFGRKNASSQIDPFEDTLRQNEINIRIFAGSLLSKGMDEFVNSLHDSIAGKIRNSLSGQKILDLRKNANFPQTESALAGVLFILALRALREVLSTGRAEKKSDFNQVLLGYLNNVDTLKAGQVVRVEPGMIHAAGPGCYLAEASNQSDNTFRIFDHGREYEAEPRPMHYDEAAVALSDESFLDSEKQKRLICTPRNENAGVLVPMRILHQDLLEAGHSFRCPRDPTHGHSVICTEGSIIISVRPEGGIPREMTIASAHAAYLRDSKDEFTIKSVKHHTSACAVICSISSPVTSQMAIKIGGTHVHFVFYAYPNPAEEETFLWYNKLHEKENLPLNFSWESRLRVFREELEKFRSKMLHMNSGNISLMTLSWPGPIWEQAGTARNQVRCVDTTWDHNSRMEAHVLGCEKTTLKDLVGGIQNINWESCLIMSLAAADIAAERKEFGGRLQDENGNTKPGLLLNFSSEICMAVAGKGDESVAFGDRNRDGGDLHINCIDQWLWFDPLTRDWFIQKTSPEDIGLSSDHKPHRRAIRLCDLLSTTAVVFRFLSEEIGKTFLEEQTTLSAKAVQQAQAAKLWLDELKKCWHETTTVLVNERATKFKDLIDKYRLHLNVATEEVFNWISRECREGNDVEHFIVEIGRDYGDLLAALYAEFDLSPFVELDPEEKLTSPKEKLTGPKKKLTIVLGGYGGVHFGSAECKASDLFVQTVNTELNFHLRARRVQFKADVVRAQASGSSTRLLRAGQWRNLIGGDK